ncbi:MAG TPA: FliM/FliN family flagellar motor switch protein [Novosphingobium sp.]
MTDQAHTFLPSGTLTNDRVSSVLSEALDIWSSAYFACVRAAVSCVDTTRHSVTEHPFKATSDHVSLSFSDRGQRRLVELALGESLEGKVLREVDRQLLDDFAHRLAADLVGRLDRLLEPHTAGPVLRLELTLDGKPVGNLLVKQQAIVELVRKSLPTKTVTARSPKARTRAVAGLPVTVEAVLGQLELTVEDAKGLAIGDVLILDRTLKEHAAIRITEGPTTVAVGHLVPENGRNTIIVAKSGKELN